jgi:hypothetical protein
MLLHPEKHMLKLLQLELLQLVMQIAKMGLLHLMMALLSHPLTHTPLESALATPGMGSSSSHRQAAEKLLHHVANAASGAVSPGESCYSDLIHDNIS